MTSYHLGDLEKEIMDILWSCVRCSVQEVVKKLQLKRPIAYTTVATVLNRLFEKKIVLKTAEKNFHYYSPRISKNEYSSSVVTKFMDDFMHSFGDAAIPSFAGGLNNLNQQDKQKLIKLLESDTHENK
jgi:predicted transcriptional regulator